MNKDIVEWASKKLTSLGYTLKSNWPENVQNTPWSDVVRFETSDGYVYLKHTPELISLEADIIQCLHEDFNASVPEVIGHNATLNCFLMKDAGVPLRGILKHQFDIALISRAIDQFTKLQITVSSNIDVLLELGVPDWRLEKLPALFEKFLEKEDILKKEGLIQSDIEALQSLLPKISDLCQDLDAYPVESTLVQPDFNDNNMLYDEISKKLTLIDLGEIVIAHPFFSLVNFMVVMRKHHGIKENDALDFQIRDACLKSFVQFDSQKNILAAFKIAQRLWPVYWTLANYRLMLACGIDKLMAYQPGKLRAALEVVRRG